MTSARLRTVTMLRWKSIASQVSPRNSDMRMPVMSGLEALQALAADA